MGCSQQQAEKHWMEQGKAFAEFMVQRFCSPDDQTRANMLHALGTLIKTSAKVRLAMDQELQRVTGMRPSGFVPELDRPPVQTPPPPKHGKVPRVVYVVPILILALVIFMAMYHSGGTP